MMKFFKDKKEKTLKTEKSKQKRFSKNNTASKKTNNEFGEQITVPIVALKNIVLLEKFVVPLFIESEAFISVVDAAMQKDKKVFVITQKNSSVLHPKRDDLFDTGVYVNIIQYLKLPDGTLKLLVEGVQKGKLISIDESSHMMMAKIQLLNSKQEKLTEKQKKEFDVLTRSVIEEFKSYIKNKTDIPNEILNTFDATTDTSSIIFNLLFHMEIQPAEKQKILELDTNIDRLKYIYEILTTENEYIQIDKKIKNQVKKQIDKNQKEFYLNEQIKAIQKEMGKEDEDIEEIEKKMSEKELPEQVKKKVETELSRLKRTPMMSAEAGVIRNYIDWLLDVPWMPKKDLNTDLNHAKKILEEEHYALNKVKERILEYIAVHNRAKNAKGSILCFMGPPGVGKTSLGQSIAKALGRDFVRVSLGGVKDESEIRGHRRTYIGSMPGRIIQSIKKTGYNNPVMLLDEIDKMSEDWRGDPSSAMLEVLDPEQNSTFNDHYLDIDYDLSNVMFITTSNSYNIPRPLLDRMEIINIEGYTEQEKIEIAKQHLIPKQMKLHALTDKEISISEDAIKDIIRYYTREAGVRGLERTISKIMRKAVMKLESLKEKPSKAEKATNTENNLFEFIKKPISKIKTATKAKTNIIKVDSSNLSEYLGVKKFDFGIADEKDAVGIVNGLAWTEVGGDILTIESVQMFGKGRCTLTGQLGDVMKESIQTAHSYIKANANSFGISAKLFDRIDIHVHVPEGATPKDGPSAGVAMSVAMVSMLTGIPVKKDIAMTGEITLRGRVLAIGGLKEKLLAALRGGIKTVLIPKDNEKDLSEIPDIVKKGLKIIPIKDAREALKYALTEPLKHITETITEADFIINKNNNIEDSANI